MLLVHILSFTVFNLWKYIYFEILQKKIHNQSLVIRFHMSMSAIYVLLGFQIPNNNYKLDLIIYIKIIYYVVNKNLKYFNINSYY